jgi:hypothetical protein
MPVRARSEQHGSPSLRAIVPWTRPPLASNNAVLYMPICGCGRVSNIMVLLLCCSLWCYWAKFFRNVNNKLLFTSPSKNFPSSPWHRPLAHLLTAIKPRRAFSVQKSTIQLFRVHFTIPIPNICSHAIQRQVLFIYLFFSFLPKFCFDGDVFLPFGCR